MAERRDHTIKTSMSGVVTEEMWVVSFREGNSRTPPGARGETLIATRGRRPGFPTPWGIPSQPYHSQRAKSLFMVPLQLEKEAALRRVCVWCEEPVIGERYFRYANGPVAHYACLMRQVLGSVAHQARRCGCYVPGSTAGDDPTLTRRQAAEAALRYSCGAQEGSSCPGG